MKHLAAFLLRLLATDAYGVAYWRNDSTIIDVARCLDDAADAYDT